MFSRSPTTPACRYRSRCACRWTRATASSATSASSSQDRWTMGRVTWNLGLRFDQFIGETRESEVLPNRFTFSGDRQRRQLPRVRGREGGPRLLRRSAELEGHLAARRLRDGCVRQRPHRPQGERGALRQRPERRRCASGQSGRSVEPHRRSAVDRPSTVTACRSTPMADIQFERAVERRRRRQRSAATSRRLLTTPRC